MHPMAALYERHFDFPRWEAEPLKTYMIAAIPRTGSTLLTLALWRSGVLGAPLEYINYKNHTKIINDLGGGDIYKYWTEIKKLRTSANGVFGFKAFISNLQETADNSEDLISDIAPNFVIYITRRNKLAHAISYALAVQTKAWFSGVKKYRRPRYNYKMIRNLADAIVLQEEAWEKIFELKSEIPIRVFYEDLVENEHFVVESICKAIGVSKDERKAIELPRIAPQASRINKNWIARYKASSEIDADKVNHRSGD